MLEMDTDSGGLREDESAGKTSRRRKRRSEKPAAPSAGIYSHLDTATEFLIYGILIFTPWVFGTTEDWAIKSVNTWNFILGGMLAMKWVLRLFPRFRPQRWESGDPSRGGDRFVVWGLAFLTVFMLGYCWVAAWNARAGYDYAKQSFDYATDYIKWLPASYDRAASWVMFRRYAAAACFFWALRDWLRTKTPREAEESMEEDQFLKIGAEVKAWPRSGGRRNVPLPARLNRLLWFLCINAAILAVEGAIQRFSGTGKLLWMVLPNLNDTASAQFGPFNYRSNGAQYLNMIWPVAVAFWWALTRSSRLRIGEGSESILLPFAAVIMGGPLISLSRGGVAVAVGQALAMIVIFAFAYRKGAWWKRVIPALILPLVVAILVSAQWENLRLRFNENSMNTLSGRTEIYENTRRIAEDFPVFGSGPGSFRVMYRMYRASPDQRLVAQTHDDFLETLVTFGRVGLTGLELMLALVFAYWFLGRGIPTNPAFVAFFWVALGGCLVHAKFDFPFQIYSLLLLFLTIGAMATTFSRR